MSTKRFIKTILILFTALTVQAQKMNVHLKDGQTIVYDVDKIDFIDFTETDQEQELTADRTVLVYMSGENSLYDFIDSDMNEMKTGSKKIGDNNLLVYVDRGRTQELPWLARIRNGEIVDKVTISEMGISEKDEYATDPKVMEAVVSYAFSRYPAKNQDYGLVLWGHASGWLLEDSVAVGARQRAYGIDNGKNTASDSGKWINIPTLASVLSKLPHLSFIFADCCNFQCLENAYELRQVTDYLIGSPAEIPGDGAPYDTVVPVMFEPTAFPRAIVDRYFAQKSMGLEVPLSVIRTDRLENLAAATREALRTIVPGFGGELPNMDGLIHYYFTYRYYDANDFMLKYLPATDYTVWKNALDQAVSYKKMATMWQTNRQWDSNYGDFTVTEARYGGASMYIPQTADYTHYQETIKKMAWYHAAGYQEAGW